MNNRFFSKNRAKGYARMLGFSTVTSAAELVAGDAIGSSILTAAGHGGHVLTDSLKMGAVGGGLIGLLALISANAAERGIFPPRDNLSPVRLAMMNVVLSIFAQMMGYGIFKDTTDMSLGAAVADTAVGMPLLNILLVFLYMYYLDDILDYLQAPFKENLGLASPEGSVPPAYAVAVSQVQPAQVNPPQPADLEEGRYRFR